MASSKKAPVPGKTSGGKPAAGKPAAPAARKAAPPAKKAGPPAKKPGPAPADPPGGLVALVDGVALPEAESAALWHAFSEHMDQHQGDMAGFARARGYASVKPEYRRGQAVLVVATR